MLSDSWKAPMFTAASPKKQSATCRLLLVLDGEGHAGRQRDVGADDRVPAEHPVLDVEQVHRAALAARHARIAPEQLGHDAARVAALHQRVHVVAIGAEDVVVGLERGHRANRHRLLADPQVTEPADLLEGVHLGAALLEAAAEQHLPQQVQLQVLRQGGGVHYGFVGHVPVSCPRSVVRVGLLVRVVRRAHQRARLHVPEPHAQGGRLEHLELVRMVVARHGQVRRARAPGTGQSSGSRSRPPAGPRASRGPRPTPRPGRP